MVGYRSASDGVAGARPKLEQEGANQNQQPTMTGHNTNILAAKAINTLLQDGLGEGLPRIAEMLLNAAMLLERASHMQAESYERTETRNGHANGFKPRSFQTAVGKLDLAVPQVRGSSAPFHTSLLESGSRTVSTVV